MFVCAGVKLCDVYNTALEMVERERPELKDNFTRNAGYTTLTLTPPSLPLPHPPPGLRQG